MLPFDLTMNDYKPPDVVPSRKPAMFFREDTVPFVTEFLSSLLILHT